MRKSKIVSLIAFISIIGLTGSHLSQAGAQNEPGKKEKMRLAMKKCTNLTRLDFQVEGSNCASCLGRIRKRMEKEPGVFEAAVCIKKPYGAAALFDGSKNKAENIMKAGIKGESKVRAFNMTVEKLSKPPFILVPKINPMEKSN